MLKTFEISLDLETQTAYSQFSVSQGDLNSIALTLKLNQDGKPVNLTDCQVRMVVRKPSGKTIIKDCPIVLPTSGTCTVLLGTQASVEIGIYTAELYIYKDDSVAVSGVFTYTSRETILDDEFVESQNDWQAIHSAIGEAREILDYLELNGTGIDVDAREGIAGINSALVNKADINYVIDQNSALDIKINSQASGSPKGVYTTLSALQTAYPTGNSNIYVVTTDGKWYYWSGSAWTAGGVYQGIQLADKYVSPLKTSFFTLPVNLWTTGDKVVTGNGTWIHSEDNITVPTGSYVLYVDKATGYEPNATLIAELDTYRTSDNVKVASKTILPSGKITEPITVNEGEYLRVMFFLSTATAITNGSATFSGIYLYNGVADELLNPKIKRENVDAGIVSEYISENVVDGLEALATDLSFSWTTTNPNTYNYRKYSYTVAEQKNYVLDIGSYSGNLSTTFALIQFMNVGGTKISELKPTGNRTSFVTPVGTTKIDIYFYLTFEAGATGTYTASFSNVNIYSIGILNEKVSVLESNLSPDVATKLNAVKTEDLLIYLPKEIVIAKGRKIDIYNKQVCHAGNLDNFHFRWVCSIGGSYKRKFAVDSTSIAAGSYTLTLEVYDNSMGLIKSLSTVLKVIDKPANNTVKTVLPIGDSMTDIDKWRKEVKLLADTMFGGNKINYIGTKGTDPLYKHEGMSGWKTSHFLANGDYTYGGNIILTVSGVTTVPASKKKYTISDSSGSHVWEFEKAVGNQYYFNRITNGTYTLNTSGTITQVDTGLMGDASITYTSWAWQAGNPFWNTTSNQLDFNDYLTKNGFTRPDYVTIYLGTNNLSNASGKYDALKTGYASTVSDLKIIVDKILSQWVGTKILLILPPFNANQDGYKNADRFDLQQHLRVYTLTEMINAQFVDYNTNVKVVPVAQTMDSDYVYGMVENAVNPRMTSVTVPMPTEVTHPQTEGFLQMADIIFGHWLAFE